MYHADPLHSWGNHANVLQNQHFPNIPEAFFFPADLKIAGKWLVILQGAIIFSVLSRLHELGKKCEEFIASEGVPK